MKRKASYPPAFSADSPQSPEAKRLVALVDKAAALTESKGKSAFPEFKKKDSEWLKGETYIFIADMSGTILMHPANPELETKSIIDLKDANGKAFMREFIETAKGKGSGWVDYMWPKPGEKSPSKKRSYVKWTKMPDGEMVKSAPELMSSKRMNSETEVKRGKRGHSLFFSGE